MEEFLKNLGVFLSGSTLAAVLVCTLGKAWIEKRIEKSIEHEYAKKLAAYEAQLVEQEAQRQEQREVRHRAALIADLLSAWISKDQHDRDRLNQLSFEAFLWLPEDIAMELSKTLSHEQGSLSIRALIMRVRQHLLGSSDSLPDWAVIVFPPSIGASSTQVQQQPTPAQTQTPNPPGAVPLP